MNKVVIISLMSCSITALHGLGDYFFPYTNQRAREYAMRLDAALRSTLVQQNYNIASENNGDATAINLYAPAHTKSLMHDAVTGLLTVSGIQNYEQLLTAIVSTKQADYNAITRAFVNSAKFVSPQASDMLSLQGTPNDLLAMPLFPLISSAQAAALEIELYLQAICRSVLFSDYGTGQGTDVDTINGGSITNNAAAILTALGEAYTGPKVNDVVTADLLFKIEAANSLIGPYISQLAFFSVPIEFQPSYAFKPYVDGAQNREFGVSFSNFVDIQNGLTPRPYVPADFSGQHYMVYGKDLATWVHNDGPGEIIFYAANILSKNNFPRSPVLPYFNGLMPNEAAFVGMTNVDMYADIFTTACDALKHAWAHKWRAQRTLRPDAFGGLVHRAQVTTTNPFNLDDSFFAVYETPAGDIDLLAWILAYNTIQQTNAVNDPLTPPQAETYLLSQLYPEGSPAHPSYPSGHATFAGAGITILKAFFKDDELIKDYITPVKPDPNDPTQLVLLPAQEGADLLTVSGELNKLAINIAMGRNFAGIHYRIDALQGILLGEQVALNYLRDRARMYNEQDFVGYELTKFDGTRVRITPDAIISL